MERAMNMKDEEKLYKRNGILYSTIPCPPENLDALKDLQARADDVMMVPYPKCGSNWMEGILRKLMTACGHTIPMLVVFRNPKDTAVSYYHFMNKNPALPNPGSWDKFFSDFLSGEGEVGDWKNHFSEAQGKQMDEEFRKKLSGTRLGAKLKYEQHSQSRSRRMLATHLHPDGTAVSFKTSKTKMLVVFRNPKDNVVSYYHFTNKNPVLPNTKSWDKFFSDFMSGKSEVGDWKNHFSEAQGKQMDEEFKKKLSGTRLEAKLKYKQYCQ
ncbi:sulfotransferase 6B1-like [Clarias magur]|uniref:Sulfotransferase n=1 Tax=Clarias magur TaxID=1594786 RepID=A0A8J4UGG8_CLAMG|nr:sulfotransferase 6B1-like [Clarias magur]